MADLSVLNIERVPDDLPHRHHELNAIRQAFEGVRGNWRGAPVRISGPSGAGKTSVAVEAARKAHQEWDVAWTAVDCISTRSRASVLHEVASGLGMVDGHLGSTPPAAYHDYFRTELEAGIAIIDEAGQLADLDVLQELLNSPTLTPVVIIHDEAAFMSRLRERIASRLRAGPAVRCDRYSLSELVDILESRLRAGGLERFITPGALEETADIAAGNARDAIMLTRRAVEYAREHDTRTTADEIPDLAPDAHKRVVQHNLGKLDSEHRTIYQIIHEAGEIRAGELATRIDARLDISSSTRARYLSALQGSYEVIAVDGGTSGRVYRPIADVPVREPICM